ncbi:DUF2066 domain-containing protein [Agaribacter flavus]|uniref:DUF2066 domain-containing protein n=1 Tax=Agaribacter flavus TaxID=1902781 RepID=A0ABV7FQT7_9ALTE
MKEIKVALSGMKYGLLLLLTIFIACIAKASAEQSVNIGRVTVQNQTVNAQKQAGKQALSQVFVKTSGDLSITENEVVKRAITNFEQYLVSSRFYQKNENLVFEAVFNHQKVINLLKASDLPVWASIRPSAIIWLAEKENMRIDQIAQNNHPEINKHIDDVAYMRGLSIITPVGDLTDSMAVSAEDVWYQKILKLQSHSIRYNTDYLINAAISPYLDIDAELDAIDRLLQQDQAPEELDATTELNAEIGDGADSAGSFSDKQDGLAVDGFLSETEDPVEEFVPELLPKITPEIVPEGTTHKLDFIIAKGDDMDIGRLYGKSSEELVTQLIHYFADKLALQFASRDFNQNSMSEVNLVIDNVSSIVDYMAITRLLENLPVTGGVVLRKQNKGVATFSVDLNTTPLKLIEILKFDGRLKQVAENPLIEDVLELRWEAN